MNSLGGFTPTSKGTLKRGGMQGDYIPKGYRASQLQQFTPEQMQLFSQLFGHVGPESNVSRLAGGDQSSFEQMEAPAHRDFQSMLGQFGSRFSGMGMGGQKSSGFKNALTAASSNFAENLASRRQELQRQALFDLMGLSGALLGQRPYLRDVSEKNKEPNYFAQAMGKLGGAIPGALSGAFSSGGSGASQGATSGFSIFPQIMSMFGGF